MHVEQDGVYLFGLERAQCFLARRGFQREIAKFRALLREGPADEFIVVHDEDALLRHFLTLSSPWHSCTSLLIENRPFNGQLDAELRAVAEGTAGLDAASVGSYDAIGERKTEAGALFARREKGLEYLR